MFRFKNRKVAQKRVRLQEEWWEGEEQVETRFLKNEIKKRVREALSESALVQHFLWISKTVSEEP